MGRRHIFGTAGEIVRNVVGRRLRADSRDRTDSNRPSKPPPRGAANRGPSDRRDGRYCVGAGKKIVFHAPSLWPARGRRRLIGATSLREKRVFRRNPVKRRGEIIYFPFARRVRVKNGGGGGAGWRRRR